MAEPALTALFQWDSVADPTTYGCRLKTITWRHNLKLKKIVTRLNNLVTKPSEQMLLFDMREGCYEVIVR